MSSFPHTVLDYWHNVFAGGAVVMNDGSLSVAVNPELNQTRHAMILEQVGGFTQVTLTPALAKQTGIDRDQDISIATLRKRLADTGVTLHDPDFIFYLPYTPAQIRTTDSLKAPRQLTGADREAFEAFRAEASEQDLEDAYVELDHWAVFGCFHGDRLVSAASMYPWDNALIADLGVLTLPDVRGKGYARAIVQAIGRFARDQGYEPQYRCQTANAASVALAEASGLTLFGKWEVIERAQIYAKHG